MPMTQGKIVSTPTPKVELGQLWKDKQGTLRRVVEPLDQWEVHFARAVDGRRSKVQRVSSWGAPSGGYTHVPKVELEPETVHVRRGFDFPDTFCGLPVENLVTTTLSNLPWWKKKRRAICTQCTKRATDGVSAALDARVA